VDVDCWTRVPGQPLRPGKILEAIQSMMPGGQA
jgi:Ni,Fe-hydrogenase III small subunit